METNELTEKEIENLIKILSDYELVLLRRIANEWKKGDFRNIKGKQDFIRNVIKVIKYKLLDKLNKRTKENKK